MKKIYKKRDFLAKELLCSGKYRQRVVESKKSKLKRKKLNLKDEMKPYSKTFVKIDGFEIRLFNYLIFSIFFGEKQCLCIQNYLKFKSLEMKL